MAATGGGHLGGAGRAGGAGAARALAVKMQGTNRARTARMIISPLDACGTIRSENHLSHTNTAERAGKLGSVVKIAEDQAERRGEDKGCRSPSQKVDGLTIHLVTHYGPAPGRATFCNVTKIEGEDISISVVYR